VCLSFAALRSCEGRLGQSSVGVTAAYYRRCVALCDKSANVCQAVTLKSIWRLSPTIRHICRLMNVWLTRKSRTDRTTPDSCATVCDRYSGTAIGAVDDSPAVSDVIHCFGNLPTTTSLTSACRKAGYLAAMRISSRTVRVRCRENDPHLLGPNRPISQLGTSWSAVSRLPARLCEKQSG